MPGSDFDSIGRPVEFPFDTAETFVLTVPPDRIFEIFAVAFVWVSTATEGNRVIRIRIQNRQTEVVFARESQLVQPESNSFRYVWAPGMPDETVLAGGNQLLQPMPLLTIGESGSVGIDDANGIDSADAVIGSISARIYKAD